MLGVQHGINPRFFKALKTSVSSWGSWQWRFNNGGKKVRTLYFFKRMLNRLMRMVCALE
jgi:hypothetical protein